MSPSDSGTHTNPLIRALAAELAQDPTSDVELPAGLAGRRESWLAQFRAGTLPFQQAAEGTVPDDLDLELWLLLEKDKAFRSRGPAGSASPGWRAVDAQGVVTSVRRAPDGATWEVRLRKAAPGSYRVEVLWEEGSRSFAELLVVEGSSEYVPIGGPEQPPTRVRLSRLDS